MDVELINPFITATKKVFVVMAGWKLSILPPQAVRHLPSAPNHVNAVIRMFGGVTGAVVLRFPRDVVLPVAQGFDKTAGTLQEGLDAIGELANMTAGDAKRRISKTLVTISVPEIVEGDAVLTELAELAPWLLVPFRGPFGAFTLATSFHPSEPASPQQKPVEAAAKALA